MNLQQEYIEKGAVSPAEQQKILNFIWDLRSDHNCGQNILRCLNKHFGCVCSSFWAVNDDYSMTNPIGVDISPTLLVDYEKRFHAYDDFGLTHMDPLVLSSARVLSRDEFVPQGRETPYTRRLKEENIHHKYSLFLRDNGKIRGTIALFEPHIRAKGDPLLSPQCLEAVAPFIEQEYAKFGFPGSIGQTLKILPVVLNSMDTGVVIFNRTNYDEVLFFNSVCVQYCFDFLSSGHPKTIVSDFLRNVAGPFHGPHPNVKDFLMELPTPSGKIYRINIRDNGDQIKNVCTMFITPQESGKKRAGIQALFSQMTPKEREVALLISQGLTNSQISNRLFISISTVKSHIQHVFEKANVSNRASLIAMLRSDD